MVSSEYVAVILKAGRLTEPTLDCRETVLPGFD